MKTRLRDAARVYTRYDTGEDETRRERNEKVGEWSPELEIPQNGLYLWNWFVNLNQSLSRIQDGFCRLIPPSEYLAWSKLTGNIVYPVEYDILKEMDAAFCTEMNKEFESVRTKQQEEQQRQIDEARSRSKRRR